MFKTGSPWWLTDAHTVSLAREEQAERYVPDAWQDLIAQYLQTQTDVAVSDVLLSHLIIDRAKWSQAEQNRVARCLKVLGWSRYRSTSPAPYQKRPWRYRRPVPVE